MKLLSLLCLVAVVSAPVADQAPKPRTSGASSKSARTIQIEGTEQMKYSLTTITARPNERLHIVLKAIGTMPKMAMAHNFVLLTKDASALEVNNAAFDWPFLVAALRRAGYAAPDAQRLCTLELSRSLDADRVLSHRLADICQRHGVALVRAHDAAADAEATAAVLPRLLDEAAIDDVAQLSPFLTGTTMAWPAVARRRRRRAAHR